MKYQFGAVKSLPGKFAVLSGRKYFPDTVTDSARDAEIASLEKSARWHRDNMDAIHNRLIALGAVNENDFGRHYLS